MIRLPTIGGVRFGVHMLLPVLLALATWAGLGREAGLLLLLLASHELAHLLFAQAFGLRLRSLQLLPTGGVAELEGLEFADPGVETSVALAGPLHNLILLALGLVLRSLGLLAPGQGAFFLVGNAALSLGNLLPALPLDGGRVVRALVAQRRGYAAAAATLDMLGRITAGVLVALCAVALLRGWFLLGPLVFGFFIFAHAGVERREAGVRGLRGLWRRTGRTPEEPLTVQGVALPAAFPLLRLVDQMVPHRYHLFWVIERGGKASGPYDEAELWRALRQGGAEVTARGLRKEDPRRPHGGI